MFTQEEREKIADIWTRMLESEDGGGLFPHENLTKGNVESVFRLVEDFRNMNPNLFHLIKLSNIFYWEFAEEQRCMVCGQTTQQSKVMNYDCAREC